MKKGLEGKRKRKEATCWRRDKVRNRERGNGFITQKVASSSRGKELSDRETTTSGKRIRGDTDVHWGKKGHHRDFRIWERWALVKKEGKCRGGGKNFRSTKTDAPQIVKTCDRTSGGGGGGRGDPGGDAGLPRRSSFWVVVSKFVKRRRKKSQMKAGGEGRDGRGRPERFI